MSLRVRSVTITGFKSFGEKIRVEFSNRVNAVVGPNGSGKSNVIEGIRWASHTARTRELRARAATELIFHGSQGKAPLNMAEVLLELEDLHGNGTVMVSRRLYRDGESELELSGKNVRVRDLHEALRGSGLGPGGLAVVGQGEIGAVIGADPETMLGYLEEAAGLSRATHRRAQTIDRLGQARAHLLRLEDLAGELRARVERLARDAAAALEHASLSAEASGLERALHRHRVNTLLEEIGKLQAEIAQTETISQTLADAIQSVSNDLETVRLNRETAQAELTQLSAEFERLGGEVRALRERASAADEGLSNAKRERGNLEREAGDLEQLTPPTPPEAPNDDFEALERTLYGARDTVQGAIQHEERWSNDLSEARARRESLERESAVARARFAAATAERETLERELEISQAELSDLETRRTQLEPGRDELEVAFQAANKLLDRLEREATSLSERIAHDGMRVAELRAARTPLSREFARLESQRQARAHLSEGPRKALSANVTGIIGPVGDLVRVPAHLETAIGAALGRRVEQIVVQDGRIAEACIEHLKSVGGRATFMPLELIRPRERRETPLWREKGVLGNAALLIETEYQTVVESLLGDTAVVETLAAALKLAKKYPARPRLVTLEGELIEPGGAVTGGRGRETFGEHFADARRVKELQAELEALETELITLEARLETDRAGSIESRSAILRADQRVSEARTRLEQSRAELTELAVRRDALEDRRTNLSAKLSALSTPMTLDGSAETIPDLMPLEVGLEDARARLTTARDAERAADLALREAQSRQAVFVERQRTFEAALARYQQSQQRLDAIRTRLTELENLEADAMTKLDAASPEIQRLEAAANALNLPAKRDGLNTLEQRRQRLETDLSERTRELSETREKLESQRLSLARREANLETLTQDAPFDNEAFTDPDGTPRSWAQRLNTIRARLEQIGLVNPLSADEHAAESARLNDLEASIADARDASNELEVALETLERDVTAKLRDAIRRVSDAFREYVRDLLGGDGELSVVRDESGALEGLALQVTPKGKRTRALHLLSAGERTMSALAFLFALSQAPEDHKGLPLAVLDEVDAPLDEANIRRFTHFLNLLADRGTQFVLVTHQKATMEIADALWGVTTDTGGLSRTFSIRQEAIPN
jgi:chromosome segregation protein